MRIVAGAVLALTLATSACSSASTDNAVPQFPSPPAAEATPSPGAATAAPADTAGEAEDAATQDAASPVWLVPEIVSTRPHDPTAWTQGLILHGERMFESTGAQGADSTLREVDQHTGETLRSLAIDQPLFAEGLERVDDRLIQLTWQDGLAFVYDLESFESGPQQTIPYAGEGWGLCRDGDILVMSDGSDRLQFRDPETFDEIAPRVDVTVEGKSLANLNELECVDGTVWANVWLTDVIVAIDPATGNVTALVDGSSLERPEGADVLNGIAYDPATGNYLLTGKRWPTTYEVRFVPAG